jgi:hypothetical protein
LMLFFARVRPLSRHRKPGCIQNTNIAENRIQNISIDSADIVAS